MVEADYDQVYQLYGCHVQGMGLNHLDDDSKEGIAQFLKEPSNLSGSIRKSNNYWSDFS